MSSDSDPDPLVLFEARTGSIPRQQLNRFAERLCKEVGRGRRFCCLIATDEDLRRFNREFRRKDYPTDVLSFPADDKKSLGEIAISIDRAREQAREFGHSVTAELQVLMLHGVLHLTGLDHEVDRGQMERAETKWRTRLGLSGGLIERVSQKVKL